MLSGAVSTVTLVSLDDVSGHRDLLANFADGGALKTLGVGFGLASQDDLAGVARDFNFGYKVRFNSFGTGLVVGVHGHVDSRLPSVALQWIRGVVTDVAEVSLASL